MDLLENNLNMKKIVLMTVAALLMAGCAPQKQAEEKQLTPQEQIIANIARTSFPDKEWPVQLDESANMLQVLQTAIDSCSY
jgi:PBP1b-binding outer membrane lipoprotein LpoB